MEKSKNSIKGIRLNLREGRLFMAAIAMLTTTVKTSSTPDEVLKECSGLADEMFKDLTPVEYLEENNVRVLKNAAGEIKHLREVTREQAGRLHVFDTMTRLFDNSRRNGDLAPCCGSMDVLGELQKASEQV